jgi:hypothetical protein
MPSPRPIERLSGILAPPGTPPRRLPHLSRFRTEDPALRARYDDTTLYYTAIWLPDQGLLRLFGPSALNLKPLLRAATYATKAGPLPAPRLRRFKRYLIAEFPLDRAADTLSMTLDGHSLSMPILHQDLSVFRGLNTVYTMSQNNDLDWIADWMRHARDRHGAEALLIADNASTAYTPEALHEHLLSLDLKALRVLSVPFRHGPSSAVCSRATEGRFLQATTINIARDLYLQAARAVLLCDVDEMVFSSTGRSVFDVALARRSGFVTFPGYWRFSRDLAGDKPRHADHVWIDPARTKPCPTKYVIVPQGPFGRWSWMPHSLERLPRKAFSGAPDLWFAHCFDIATRWKEGRDAAAARDDWQYDAVLAALWASAEPRD